MPTTQTVTVRVLPRRANRAFGAIDHRREVLCARGIGSRNQRSSRAWRYFCVGSSSPRRRQAAKLRSIYNLVTIQFQYFIRARYGTAVGDQRGNKRSRAFAFPADQPISRMMFAAILKSRSA